jgi:hypothetical protein
MYEFSHDGGPLAAASLDRSIALLRWGGFWTAILLPLVHVPLLVATGLGADALPVLLALWLANVVALVLGRQHDPHGRPALAEGGKR